MRIAIMGTRGVPANYGGFETFAYELGRRLAAKGEDVTVYCRSNYVERSLREHEGMRLVVLPVLRHKYFETVLHTGLSVLHALFRERFDVVLMCNSANAIWSWIPRLKGQKVVLNVDGLEWKRKKWNLIGRLWYRLGAWLSTKCPNEIVTDAAVIERFYEEHFRAKSVMIPYGATVGRVSSADPIKALALEPEGYFLYVSRLEPENNAHVVMSAFKDVPGTKKLAIVGSAPYAHDYIRKLKGIASQDERIVMPGGVYGAGYLSLQVHAAAYIHATEVGGTHPALVEAMASGNCILVYGTPENLEVVGDAALPWHTEAELIRNMNWVLENEHEARRLGERAATRADEVFSWDSVTSAYEGLFSRTLGVAPNNAARSDLP